MVSGQVRDDEVAPVPPPARPQRPVAIVGGGSIGVGWAVVFARGQQQVNVFEPAPRRRQLFPGELRRRLEALADSGLIEEDVSVVADRVSVSADLPEAVGPSCYVQECSPEDADVKRSVFESLDRYSSSDAVLASSSSALPASEIATGLSCAPTVPHRTSRQPALPATGRRTGAGPVHRPRGSRESRRFPAIGRDDPGAPRS